MKARNILALATILLSCRRVELPNGYRCIANNASDYAIVRPSTQDVVVGSDMDEVGVFGSFVVAHYKSLAPVPKGFRTFEEENARRPLSGYWVLDTSSGKVEYFPEGDSWAKALRARGAQIDKGLSALPPFFCE
jgi:hypothetical protein